MTKSGTPCASNNGNMHNQKKGRFILQFSILLSMISFIIAGSMMSSCNKDKDDTKTTPIAVHMTDDPGPYNAVNIDLLSVEVTGNDGVAVVLNTHPGIYNLLDFANGLDTLIATGNLTLSRVEQIRLILGPNNTIVVNQITYPLSTPSAEQSGLKLQVHQTLQPGVAYNVLIDFDANQSIVVTGNGQYKLKPVLRTVETALSGSIKGKIVPAGILASVTAISNGVSYSSAVNVDGYFILKGLPVGTYAVTITPESPLSPVTVNDVVVAIGISTDMGIILL